MTDTDSAERLRHAVELNRQMIEAMPGGVVHVRADGRILNANAEAQRLLGLSFDELAQRYTHDFEPQTIHEDGRPFAVADYPVSRVLATGQRQPPVTIGVRRPDGDLSWAVFSAIPTHDPATDVLLGAIVTFVDITERKRAEAALAESAATLRAVVDNAPSVIITTTPAGVITFISRSEWPEYPPERLVGTSLLDHLEPADAERVRGHLELVRRTRVPTGYEVQVSRPDGTPQIWAARVGPVIAGDAVVALSVTSTEVTELRALQSRLIISDRLASIGTLAAGVAHEINNPLTYLMLSLAHLRAELAGHPATTPELRLRIADAEDGAERIRKIVLDLGGFGRGADDQSPVDLAAVLDSCVKMAGNELRYRATVVRDYGPVPLVLGSAPRLHQALLNLIVNAAQAIPVGNAGGNQVRLRTDTRADGWARVTVSDTGPGIAPELLPRIFDPFVTGKPVGEGTGLGLHICHRIVRECGGELVAESPPGGGATFTLALPPAPAGAASSAGSMERPAPRPDPGAVRALIVDDEPALLAVLAGLLEDMDVTTCTSGQQALARLADEPEPGFDVVLCDLIMPNVSGMDVFESIRASRPELASRFLFMTGGSFTPQASAFAERYPERMILKPFDLDALRSAVLERAAAR